MRILSAAVLLLCLTRAFAQDGPVPNPWGSRTLDRKAPPPTGLKEEDYLRNTPRAPQMRPPRVVVCVAVDQFRWDYLEKAWPALGPWGFRRLVAEGQVNLHTRYEYANTLTAPGHATMMTGVNPSVHGIVGNNWFDRASGRDVGNVRDDRHRVVTSKGVVDGRAVSPHRLLVETVGDRLERATQGASITLSISYKDRGAVLMAGHNPDEVYWFDDAAMEMVTSTYYAQALPDWMVRWNAQGRHRTMAGLEWRLSRNEEFYAARCTPDDQPGETALPLGRTFPKQFLPEVGPQYFKQFEVSPFADLFLVETAIAGMQALGIGKDEVPDLVTISLSAFDLAGHLYGPDSWEMLDFVLKQDFTIGKLLDYLDREVGEGQYTLLMTADHGVAPLVEVAQSRRLPAARIRPDFAIGAFNEALAERLGALDGERRYISGYSNEAFLLAADLSAEQRRAAAEALVEIIVQEPGFHSAWTRDVVFGAAAPKATLLGAVQASAHPARGGDVYFVLQPYHLFSSFPEGTTHSGPWEYDQRVPFFAFGRGFGANGPDRTQRDLPEATSPRFMATAAMRVLGID